MSPDCDTCSRDDINVCGAWLHRLHLVLTASHKTPPSDLDHSYPPIKLLSNLKKPWKKYRTRNPTCFWTAVVAVECVLVLLFQCSKPFVQCQEHNFLRIVYFSSNLHLHLWLNVHIKKMLQILRKIYNPRKIMFVNIEPKVCCTGATGRAHIQLQRLQFRNK